MPIEYTWTDDTRKLPSYQIISSQLEFRYVAPDEIVIRPGTPLEEVEAIIKEATQKNSYRR